MRPIRSRLRRCRRPYVVLVVLGLLLDPSVSRSQEPEEREGPNREPSSSETLFDQSDLGNVAQQARLRYHSAARDLQRAEKLVLKASQESDADKRAKLREKGEAAYRQAAESFREALSFDPDLLEAYVGLGAALRASGRAEEALQTHAVALRRAPDDLENFRGWTTSLLALDMLGNATAAYTEYAESQPARAQILMTAIKQWLAAKRSNPGDLDPADIERLAAWIAQQERAPSG